MNKIFKLQARDSSISIYIFEIWNDQGWNIGESISENWQDSFYLFLLPNLSTCGEFQKE